MSTIVSHRLTRGTAGAMHEDGGMGDWVVVMRFVVPVDRAEEFLSRARTVCRLLADLPGCAGVDVGRASDDRTLWTLVSRWDSVGDYRRALSSYDVKLNAVPFLSQAIDEPTAFEVLHGVDSAGERTASGDLAGDAETVDRSR
jgi:quinol monooxygenase YgiN